ncbi:MAG: hypothetical protein WCC69_15835 [Pirellulales bacterium]
MHTFWKWLAVAGCGVGLLVAADRLRTVRADDDAPAYERSGGGDSLDRLDRIVEKLGRVVERMEHGGPPPHDRPLHRRPPHDSDGPRGEHSRPPHGHRHHPGPGFGPGPGPMWGEMSPEMKERMEKRLEELPPEVRERVEKRMEEGRKRMEEMRDRMEKARAKFKEMEERIEKLEAEVAGLKAGK